METSQQMKWKICDSKAIFAVSDKVILKIMATYF